MQVQSKRSLEMLRLMEVDVWQLRPAISKVSPEDSIGISNEVAQGTNVQDPSLDWVINGAGNPEANWLFLCQNEGLTQELFSSRLYDAILFALGLDRNAVYTVVATQQTTIEPAMGKLVPFLETYMERHVPHQIVVMGEQCSQALLDTDKSLHVLRKEAYNYPGTDCMLQVTFGLDWLLFNPLDKAKLWQDLLAIRDHG